MKLGGITIYEVGDRALNIVHYPISYYSYRYVEILTYPYIYVYIYIYR